MFIRRPKKVNDMSSSGKNINPSIFSLRQTGWVIRYHFKIQINDISQITNRVNSYFSVNNTLDVNGGLMSAIEINGRILISNCLK